MAESRDRPDAARRDVDVLHREGDVGAAAQLAVEHGGRDGRTALALGRLGGGARGRVRRDGGGLVAADGHLLGLRAAAPGSTRVVGVAGATAAREGQGREGERRCGSAESAGGAGRCAHDDSFVGPVVGGGAGGRAPSVAAEFPSGGLDPVTTRRQTDSSARGRTRRWRTDSSPRDGLGRPERRPPRVASGAWRPRERLATCPRRPSPPGPTSSSWGEASRGSAPPSRCSTPCRPRGSASSRGATGSAGSSASSRSPDTSSTSAPSRCSPCVRRPPTWSGASVPAATSSPPRRPRPRSGPAARSPRCRAPPSWACRPTPTPRAGCSPTTSSPGCAPSSPGRAEPSRPTSRSVSTSVPGSGGRSSTGSSNPSSAASTPATRRGSRCRRRCPSCGSARPVARACCRPPARARHPRPRRRHPTAFGHPTAMRHPGSRPRARCSRACAEGSAACPACSRTSWTGGVRRCGCGPSSADWSARHPAGGSSSGRPRAPRSSRPTPCSSASPRRRPRACSRTTPPPRRPCWPASTRPRRPW